MSPVEQQALKLAQRIAAEVSGAVLEAVHDGKTDPGVIAEVAIRAVESASGATAVEILANITNTAGEPV
jgi:hypothetical protein